jgi:hypothetical protein
MAGLVPAIHALFDAATKKSWMPGTRPGMTKEPKSGNYTHDNQV